MANMIEKFKENKKVMEIKMEQASKMADAAADEFVKTLEPLLSKMRPGRTLKSSSSVRMR